MFIALKNCHEIYFNNPFDFRFFYNFKIMNMCVVRFGSLQSCERKYPSQERNCSSNR